MNSLSNGSGGSTWNIEKYILKNKNNNNKINKKGGKNNKACIYGEKKTK